MGAQMAIYLDHNATTPLRLEVREAMGLYLGKSFTITHVKDCMADPTKNRIVVECSDDISPVFPYLNAIIFTIMYAPAVNSVTVKRGERILSLYPRVAKMAKVDGAEDATGQLSWFKDLCNGTWRWRGESMPLYERRTLLGWLDVYRLLPGLNSGECGEAACTAFAVG